MFIKAERSQSRKRARWPLAGVVSVAAHAVAVAVIMLNTPPAPQQVVETPPIIVTLEPPPLPPPPPPPPPVEPTPEESAPAPAAEAPAAATPAPAPKTPTPRVRPTPPRTPTAPRRPRPLPRPPEVEPVRAPPEPAPAPMVTLGDAELAGAITAGSGRANGQGTGGGNGSGAGGGAGGGGDGRGGGCDMVARLQAALRDDPEVRSAIAEAHRSLAAGRTPLLWNGDWIRSQGQEGEGLAGVRQAIAVEVAFAPAACKSQRVNGVVLIRFTDAANGPKVALGRGSWRWTDLLGAGRR